MKFLLFSFGAFLAAGLFFFAAEAVKLPQLTYERAMRSAVGGASRLPSFDALCLEWAGKLAKHIRLDQYRRRRLERTLAAAGMDVAPEVYEAYTLVKPGVILLCALICLAFLPLLAPLLAVLAVLVYFKESRRADELAAKRRAGIEAELPRFVATIEQELAASRDVLTILENYKKHADSAFAQELGVLTADMRSGSYEAALTRFEGRVGSPSLSDIVRGLLGVLQGDDGRMYFQMLGHDLRQRELQQLRAEAAKILPKIRVFSFLMLSCFLLTYIVVIVMQIMQSMQTLF